MAVKTERETQYDIHIAISTTRKLYKKSLHIRHIDNVNVYTFCKSRMLLDLLSVPPGTSRFTSETIHNDLDTSIDFIAMVN